MFKCTTIDDVKKTLVKIVKGIVKLFQMPLKIDNAVERNTRNS